MPASSVTLTDFLRLLAPPDSHRQGSLVRKDAVRSVVGVGYATRVVLNDGREVITATSLADIAEQFSPAVAEVG